VRSWKPGQNFLLKDPVMSEYEKGIPIQAFAISDEQTIELVHELNEVLDERRSSISVKRNLNPFEGYPVIKEKLYLHVPEINEEDGSIYVENIVISRDEIKMHIDTSLTIIKSLLKSNHLIERFAKQQDDERALRGESRLANLTGQPKAVQWGDRLVASLLADAYKAITGLAPTMGGYKKPKARAGSPASSRRTIRSPFAVFAMKLIQIGEISRLGAGEYSVAILRKAMSQDWRYAASGGSRLKRATLLKIAEAMPAKGPGRPPAGEEPWRLRTPELVEVDEYTPTEAEARTWDEFQVDDEPLLTCRLRGSNGVGL